MQDTQIVKVEDVKVVKTKISGMQKAVEAVDITDAVSVKTMVANIKKLLDFVKQRKASLVDPAKAIIDEAKEIYDPFIEACESAKKELTTRATQHVLEQRRKEDEERDRIAAEKKKKDDKIAADLAAGKISEEKAAEKMDKTAENAIGAMSEVAEVKATHGGVTVRMIPTVVFVDRNLIPDEYWVVDEVRVRKAALAGVVIPGVVVEKKASGGFSGH